MTGALNKVKDEKLATGLSSNLPVHGINYTGKNEDQNIQAKVQMSKLL